MKCEIIGINIRVFGKAIHSLAKMGDELYFESDASKGVALRVVNSARSAFMSVAFDIDFFTLFDNQDEDNAKTNCKVAIHPCASIFKSLTNIDKTVDKCSIVISDNNPQIIFQLNCRYGIIKTCSIPFLDSESLQAVYEPQNCKNTLTAHSKLLAEAFGIFHSNQEEVTLVVDKSRAQLKSYMDGVADPKIEIYSQLQLQPEEFDEFTVTNNTGITFCLKEIKALLTFTEMLQQSVTISFDHGGKPIIFTVRTPSMFKVTFVLATVEENSQADPQSSAVNANESNAANQSLINASHSRNNGEPQTSRREIEPEAHFSGWKGNKPVAPTSARTDSDKESDPPTVKRFKSLFLGGQQKTSHPAAHNVLVFDTDDENSDDEI